MPALRPHRLLHQTHHRANDPRLVEKVLFTKAVFLTQRLASCLYASAKIIKGSKTLTQVETIQEAWATVHTYTSKDDLSFF